MADWGFRTRPFWLPSRGDTSHILIIQDTNDSARHGQNQEKEKSPTTELNIFLWKFFFDGK